MLVVFADLHKRDSIIFFCATALHGIMILSLCVVSKCSSNVVNLYLQFNESYGLVGRKEIG